MYYGHSLETPTSFYNRQTKHDTETKLTSIDFSQNLHPSTSLKTYIHRLLSKLTSIDFSRNLLPWTLLAESQKALEAHGCKSWVTNLSIVPHTLGTLTANITYCIQLLE